MPPPASIGLTGKVYYVGNIDDDFVAKEKNAIVYCQQITYSHFISNKKGPIHTLWQTKF